MKIAVIGAGLAGLAVAHFLSKKGEVTLYDKKGIGGGASGVCSGLCHPFPGRAAKRSVRSKEGMEKTRALLEFAQKFAKRPLFREGIFRLPIASEQEQVLASYPDVIRKGEGFWIPKGLTVDVPAYLEALFVSMDAKLHIGEMDNSSSFDQVVIATGYGAKGYTALSFIKGQVVRVRGKSRFETSTIAKGYMATLGGDTFEVGSTYERNFTTDEPDLEEAIRYLPLDTFVEKGEIISCKAGIRVNQKGTYLPLVKRLDEKTVLFTGLGSRGLLYHALFAEEVASLIQ